MAIQDELRRMMESLVAPATTRLSLPCPHAAVMPPLSLESGAERKDYLCRG